MTSGEREVNSMWAVCGGITTCKKKKRENFLVCQTIHLDRETIFNATNREELFLLSGLVTLKKLRRQWVKRRGTSEDKIYILCML